MGRKSDALLEMKKKSNYNVIRNILPSQYAEELGSKFIEKKSKKDSALLGQYFTPLTIANKIANGFIELRGDRLVILDPGAGSGVLSCVLCEKIIKWKYVPREIHLTAYEIDKTLVSILKKSFDYLANWLKKRNVSLVYCVKNTDFVLENAAVLDNKLQRSLFRTKHHDKFDLIIANPPYFKISKSDQRAKVSSTVIHGQPNIYALFMSIAASLLVNGGQLGFITPRSFASGLYFKMIRKHLFSQISPVSLHVFEARDKAFGKDEVLQENIILHGKKDGAIDRKNHEVKISSSNGISDLERCATIKVSLQEIIAPENGYILHIPTTTSQLETIRVVKSWKYNLKSLGLEVSTGPIVPFRTRELLVDSPAPQTAPLLWLHNVKTMFVCWPLKLRKPQYVKYLKNSKKLLLPNMNYVLIRRFSAKEEKKRLVAAPLLSRQLESDYIGIENHLNYIYRKDGELSEVEAIGLAAILNSDLLDSYFRIFNGNTQVSATELRNFPLPSPHIIEKIGMAIRSHSFNQNHIDKHVVELVNSYV